MKIEIIHQRDPDGECGFSYYVDGVRAEDVPAVEIRMFSLDAGAGCSFADWAGNAAGAINAISEAAKWELREYYADPCGDEYIDNWPEGDAGDEWIDHIEDTPENRAWWVENVPDVPLEYVFNGNGDQD
ncbi:hypothetical protein [Mycolicibacterium sphagni]|uniref:hypothetical protein n=1 Tax=Mycolicibacterium sphagni TaxID=1786 RepID=UPI0021F38200|nr:hypothetical protein [Mycolicibacterium sphagni]MCV7174838.1 hypothetical protein [Mycolicibacterium sphagni]